MRTLYFKRFLRLMIGLLLAALGIYFTIRANVGLAPWDAFSMGVSMQTGLLYGDVVVLTGLVIIILDFFLKEKIGFGTILNALLVGKFTDFFLWLDWIPEMQSLASGVVLLLTGHVIFCYGCYLYIGAAFGCGPRDSLMVALGKRLDWFPIGLVRGLIEGTVLLIGWLLGAKVGIGTVISVFGISSIMQAIFRVLRFNVKAVSHESIPDTVRNLLLSQNERN